MVWCTLLFGRSHGLIDVDCEVTSPSYNIRALRYSSVTLQCHVTVDGQQADCDETLVWYWWRFGDADKTLIWYTSYSLAVSYAMNGYQRKLIGSNYTLADRLRDGHSITFTKIRPEDTGVYYCSCICHTEEYWARGSTPNITVTVASK